MIKTEANGHVLFNERLKKHFLEAFPSSTAKSYERIFKLTRPYEVKRNKDLNEMNQDELEQVLFMFKAENLNTIEAYARVISSYLNWSVENNYSRINHLAFFKPEDFSQFMQEEEYINNKNMLRIESLIQNYQDAVIPRLIFEGVSGKSFSELTNLKNEDVDFKNNILHLTETIDDTHVIKRTLQVSTHAMEMIKGAMKQDIYYKKNGESQGRGAFLRLADSEYVLRGAVTNNRLPDNRMDFSGIHRKLRMLENSLGLPAFTAKFIQRSGVIQAVSDMMEGDEITTGILNVVADRFKIKSVYGLKSYVTLSNIEKCRNN